MYLVTLTDLTTPLFTLIITKWTWGTTLLVYIFNVPAMLVKN